MPNNDKEIGNSISKVLSKVQKNAKNQESFNTGLIGEQLIISAYKTMPLDKLIKLRYIMNKLIKQKKEYKRIQESKQ